MRVFLLPTILLLCLWSACQQNTGKATTDHPPPNFIFFITDDISQDDLGCYGNPFVQTLNIDALAAKGVVFDNAYLTTSSCSPSRNSIITGRYPHNTGAPELHQNLPDNQVMFPQLLKERGYYTVLSGKNHMGPATEMAFDTISGGKGPGKEQDWVDLLAQRPQEQPFFFCLASTDAHRGWQLDSTGVVYHPDSIEVPPMLFDGPKTREDLAQYYHEVSRTDYYMGQLWQELERQGLTDNTYIIHCSDNGRPFPRCKSRLYDCGIKTPFIVYGPGVETGRTDALISTIDIAPTVLELAGVPVHERMQGVSFSPILENTAVQTRDFIFAEHNWHVYQAHERMVRHGDWMYIRNWLPNQMAMSVESSPHFPAGEELWAAYAKGETSPEQEDVFLQERPAEELYNLAEDPHQFNNLATEPAFAERLNFLSQKLDEWVTATGDHLPDPITGNRETMERERYPGWDYGLPAGHRTGADTIVQSGPIVLK